MDEHSIGNCVGNSTHRMTPVVLFGAGFVRVCAAEREFLEECYWNSRNVEVSAEAEGNHMLRRFDLAAIQDYPEQPLEMRLPLWRLLQRLREQGY